MAVRDRQRLTERYTEIETERYGAEREMQREGEWGREREKQCQTEIDKREREKQMQTDADRERHAEREAEREADRLIYKQSDTE